MSASKHRLKRFQVEVIDMILVFAWASSPQVC